jgi:putative ABC transport system permease protein
MIYLTDEVSDYVVVRVEPRDLPATIDFIAGQWAATGADSPFQYTFLDDEVDRLYRAEARLGQVVLVFSVLALGIVCLGLLGLAAYTAEQRRREIGIRKVFGAMLPDLLWALSRDTLYLVLAALLIATPLARLAMQQWLGAFAYHIDIGWVVFLQAGLLALAIALATTGYQTVRAARASPIDALRHE